jgi:hypothetical protein
MGRNFFAIDWKYSTLALRYFGIYKSTRNSPFPRHEFHARELSSYSLDIFRTALCGTLNMLDEDRELDEFVAGIPGFSQSEVLGILDPLSPNYASRSVLAALPGPASFHEQLPWSIIQLSHRAIAGGHSDVIWRRMSQVCLKALYYIPGAIRDVLAPYATGTYYCLENLPLLNSAESLDLIKELWGTDNDDISLSVRCVAAAISAFVITPPDHVLDNFLPPGVRFIGRDEAGSNFLSRRLHMVENRVDSDSARLQNLVVLLNDIKTAVLTMDAGNRDSRLCYGRRAGAT